MTTTELNSLFEYILSLNLSKSNSQWLATRILESAGITTSFSFVPKPPKIPKMFRCNQFEISSFDNPFFADKKYVEFLRKRLIDAQQSDPSTLVRTKNRKTY